MRPSIEPPKYTKKIVVKLKNCVVDSFFFRFHKLISIRSQIKKIVFLLNYKLLKSVKQ